MNEDDKETARFKEEQKVLLDKIKALTPLMKDFLWSEETKECWPSKDGVRTIPPQDDPNIGTLANNIVKMCEDPVVLNAFNEPASQRSTSMLEKASKNGVEEYKNPTMDLFARRIPEAEGIGASLIAKHCVFFDLFWWHLPFKFNLKKFLSWLATERPEFFEEFKALQERMISAIILFCSNPDPLLLVAFGHLPGLATTSSQLQRALASAQRPLTATVFGQFSRKTK